MHAEVEFPTEIFTGRLLVPQQAILVRGGRKLVFAVEGDTAKWRYIEVGLENERFAESCRARSPAGASRPATRSSSRGTSPWPRHQGQHRR